MAERGQEIKKPRIQESKKLQSASGSPVLTVSFPRSVAGYDLLASRLLRLPEFSASWILDFSVSLSTWSASLKPKFRNWNRKFRWFRNLESSSSSSCSS